ncbi:T9SS type A sorting domain-containing protein [bacterium BMS3Abin03]|nr:T9SS type A sorting domain-containing protein [bacterium BMS3Abin03]
MPFLKTKTILTFLILTVSVIDLFPQSDSLLKFIFIPHPRSEDRENLSVNPDIAKIDFSMYDVLLLGGDLTFDTDNSSATLAHCDSVFDLGNPNTLWSLGNHDVQSGHRQLIKDFTGRDSYYSYTRDGITFLVLDTELDANGSSSTFITGAQLQMVQNVCDSIKDSRYLILLHHRLMWMINNDDFKDRLTDSIALSSRLLDTTNFYSDIYPLLQTVKNKGIQVLVFGGDRSDFNVEYNPEDSITFYAAALSVDVPDSLKNVIVLNYNLSNKLINIEFVPLFEDTITTDVRRIFSSPGRFVLNQNYPNPFNPTTTISWYSPLSGRQTLKIYDILGNEITTLVNEFKPAGNYEVMFDGSNFPSGVYYYRLQSGKFTETKKLVLLR